MGQGNYLAAHCLPLPYTRATLSSTLTSLRQTDTLNDLPAFIETERSGSAGEAGELEVWDAVKRAFSGRECLAYWRYPLFSPGAARREPDILVLDKELGLVVIEVKSIYLEQLIKIDGYRWTLKNYPRGYAEPYNQALKQLQTLLGYCNGDPLLAGKVPGRVLVALPYVRSEEWLERGFYHQLSAPPVLCEDNLGRASFLRTVKDANPVAPGYPLDDERMLALLRALSGVAPSEECESSKNGKGVSAATYTGRGKVVDAAKRQLWRFDLQQEIIAKQIPPGPQRIRGIAGSGKTVLLCQKAAQMHLKHPDWDIALVFFTRSLYDLILSSLDKWLRHFTSGEQGYDPSNSKLQVLHAWGGRGQPGFYSQVALAQGVQPKTVGQVMREVKGLGPTGNYAYALKSLLERLEHLGQPFKPVYDVVLVDEGQDLVAEDDFKFQGKQPFYWLAYQSLRPARLAAEARALFEEVAADPATADQRRLIWAYDEAQSLDSLVIPTYREVFGDEVSKVMLSGGVAYQGGVAKNEVMQRCYRTPGPILAAAHGIGMGLLRSEGVLSALTTKESWQRLGYEVEGDFRRLGDQVTLTRPRRNSPNAVPELYDKDVLTFNTYRSRGDEVRMLARLIERDLAEGLEPSRDLLVITLGNHFEAKNTQEWLARALSDKGISYFIPGNKEVDVLEPHWRDKDPNSFWCKGAVTLSRIHQAKGNEADVVYVVGFDAVAKREDDITLRNQIFVALTRSRGWAHLSGVGNYPMFEEMREVMACGERLSFTFTRQPKRHIVEE